MVGVPRSKGCLTCRRRKVACDQSKPSCRACQKHGVTCEGYAQYPVVLQWTSGGLKKRQRFEEAKSAVEAGPSGTSYPLGRRSTSPRNSPSGSATALSRQPNTGPFVIEQIKVHCLHTYLPRDVSAAEDLKSSWMWSIVTTTDHGRALFHTFSALCLARLGLVQGDQNLVGQGRDQYALGLTAVQDALNTPGLAFEDRTLAAIRTLSIYEMFALPFTSMSTAHTHERGMTQWCLAAGPHSISSEFALQVFLDVRWCIMNRDIETRKCSILGNEEWRTLPWRTFPKDTLQQLFDVGFALAAILEQLDLSTQASMTANDIDQLVARCYAVRQYLEEWYHCYLASRAASQPSVPSYVPEELMETRANSRPDYANLWEATNILYYWLFNMILNDISSSISQLTDEHQFEGTAPAWERTGSPAESSVAANVDMAVKIVQASSFFLAPETGWLGPQRFFFPIRKAMEHLGKAQSPLFTEALAALKLAVARLRAL